MNKEQMEGYKKQIVDFVTKNKTMVIAALAAVVVVFAGWNWYQSQPKSVVSVVEVEFSGYDGYGVLEYNYEDLQKEIAKVSYLKAGFSKSQAEDLINNDAVMLAEVEFDSDLSSKQRKAIAMMTSVSYEFDKTSELSNGDSVVLKIKTSSGKSPIKKENKSFKVKGLDKVDKLSSKAFLEEYPVEFVGFNGYGSLVLPKDEDGYTVLSNNSSKTSNFKNGDIIELEISSDLAFKLKEDGKKVESNVIEVEVSGLQEISKISNVSDALGKNDTYVKASYENTENTTYTIEKQKDYISYQTSGYYDDDASGQIYLVTVYKLTTASKYSDTRVEYVYYGYRYYVNSDSTLDLETANKISGYKTQDLANLTAELETDGYKEYGK